MFDNIRFRVVQFFIEGEGFVGVMIDFANLNISVGFVVSLNTGSLHQLSLPFPN